MNPKIKYPDGGQVYLSNYVRNAKAVAVLWAVFTICLTIISTVVFLQAEWIGATDDAPSSGHFGLFKYCKGQSGDLEQTCRGRFDDFYSILSPSFRTATIFVGLSVIVTSLCTSCMLLFIFIHSPTVFYVCGWMQTLAALCMAVGVLVYPTGWDHPIVREVCGDTDDFSLDKCEIKWVYILAVISVLDGIILATLAFVLGTRYVVLQAETVYMTNASSVPRGQVNGGFLNDSHSVNGSRKSMNLQPVMILTPHQDTDRFSDYSRAHRLKTSSFRPDYVMTSNVHI